MSSAEHSGRSVEACLTYTVDTGVKPVTGTTGPDGKLRHRSGEFQEHLMTVHDARPGRDSLSLEREGFVLVDHETGVQDFYDSQELKSVYYPEIEHLIKDHTGASRVVCFNHTIRSGDEPTREKEQVWEPVHRVHNDYTEWSGPDRFRGVLPNEAEELLKKRMAVVQVWRPIRNAVRMNPLAMCEAKSLSPDDLIAATRRYKDWDGETYHVSYNPDHRWIYFPNMEPNEALIFKVYDSEKDGRARFTPHTSFDDPTSPPDAPPRESIEMRTFAFFD